MKENDISYQIRGAIFKIYNELGPGLLESVYENALAYELKQLNYDVKQQVGVPLVYADIKFEVGYRLDLLVDNAVIIEVKSVEALQDVHKKQLLTYLKLAKIKLGILVNFNTDKIENAIIRIVNGL